MADMSDAAEWKTKLGKGMALNRLDSLVESRAAALRVFNADKDEFIEEYSPVVLGEIIMGNILGLNIPFTVTRRDLLLGRNDEGWIWWFTGPSNANGDTVIRKEQVTV